MRTFAKYFRTPHGIIRLHRLMIQNKIGMIGSGSWASALVKILLENKEQEVVWWVRNPQVREGIALTGRNPLHLQEVEFDTERLHLSGQLGDVVAACSHLFLAVPSAYIGDTLETIPADAYAGRKFVSAIKGLLPRRKKTVSMYLEQTIGASVDDVCVISGPSHAEEVAAEMPTFLTVASRSHSLYEEVEQMLKCHYIHTSHSTDIDGVERCGLGKNIYAIAAGMCQGLGYGDNLNAVLTTAAYREMARLLNRCLPSENRDMSQACYLGDLMVTCWSNHSRNRRLGSMVAVGTKPEDAFAAMGTIAEGYYSVRNLHELAGQLQLHLPIAEAVYRVLYEHSDPRKEMEELIAHVF